MIVIHYPNPLRTEVILSPEEREQFWYRLKAEHVENAMATIHHHLTAKDGDREKAIKACDPNYWVGDDDTVPSIADRIIHDEFKELLRKLRCRHSGECLSFTSTCYKCRAENVLGFRTLEGLGKAAALVIEQAFIKGEGCSEDTEYEVALERLHWWARINKSNQQYQRALYWYLEYSKQHAQHFGVSMQRMLRKSLQEKLWTA